MNKEILLGLAEVCDELSREVRWESVFKNSHKMKLIARAKAFRMLAKPSSLTGGRKD